jgi:poly-beta-1,6-N-acetyl-D-glucosamine synthase
MIYFCIALFLSVIYVVLIFYIVHGWNNANESKINKDVAADLSIIIPVKNESANINKCVGSILQNNFKGNFEIIIVNDHSSDDTIEKASSIQDQRVSIYSLENTKGKKNAITYGISKSTFDYIIIVDGDCIVPNLWLSYIASSFLQLESDVLVGPVKIISNGSLIDQFECYDTAAMMAITANGIVKNQYFLANGANLAFKKNTFIDIGGYEGNQDIASGDDVFFVNKAAKKNKKISFLKSDKACVMTYAQPNFASLLQQRKRWATKTKSYANATIILIQALVFSINFYILVTLLLGPFICHCLLCSGIGLLIVKLLTDYIFLKKMMGYFNLPHGVLNYLKSALLYPVMMTYMGFQALWPSKYKWKGEVIQK